MKTAVMLLLGFLLVSVPAIANGESRMTDSGVESRHSTSPRSEQDGGSVAVKAGERHVSTGEKLARMLLGRGLSPEAIVALIATLPIVELRGAVPVGINLFGLPWYRVVLFAVLGNMIPIFLILLLLEKMVGWLSHIGFFRRFFEWLFARTRRKSGLIQRYEFWGLMLFVSIPLPVTGAWTGSVAAVIMDIPYWRAMLAIFCGVLIAGGVVTTLSLLGAWGAAIAGAALLVLVVVGILSSRRRRRQRRDVRPPGDTKA